MGGRNTFKDMTMTEGRGRGKGTEEEGTECGGTGIARFAGQVENTPGGAN